METKKEEFIKNEEREMNEKVMTSSSRAEKSERSRAIASSGIGGAFGGVAGVVIGSAVSQELHAQEVNEIPVVEPEPEVQPEQPEPIKPQQIDETPEKPEGPVGPEVIDGPTPPGPTNPETPEIQVLAYEVAQAEDGHIVQTAAITVNGELVQMADVTGDDRVDLMAYDVNQDDIITEDEVFDVSEEGISMAHIRDAYLENQAIAQNTDMNEPDYINDGDVSEYSNA